VQTSFTLTQLLDPQVASSEKILRACVHCGFCTATCPTYVLLGDELDSPRGRIYLIKDMLENDKPASKEVATHIDRCLSCLACMTTCPSGVHYMHLVDHAREHIEKTYKRPFADRMLRALLARVGLAERWGAYPHELSGGQQQRVAIARALVNEPRVVLADEPTGNLDSLMARGVMELLEEINRQGTTIIMVTHDPELAARAQRNVHIIDGQVVDLAEDPRFHTLQAAAGVVQD